MEGLNSDLQVVKQQLHEAQRTTTEERAQVCNAGPSVVSTMRCVLLTWVSRSQNGRLQVALTTAKSARESLEAEIAHMKQQTSHNSSVRGASMCVCMCGGWRWYLTFACQAFESQIQRLTHDARGTVLASQSDLTEARLEISNLKRDLQTVAAEKGHLQVVCGMRNVVQSIVLYTVLPVPTRPRSCASSRS